MFYFVMLVTWPIGMFDWEYLNHTAGSLLIEEAIKCLTSIVIFFLFTNGDRRRIFYFNRYGIMKTQESVEDSMFH
jgi:hypothetical protein